MSSTSEVNTHIDGLSKNLTKKFHRELMDSLTVLFPQTEDGKDPDPFLLTAWLKLQSVLQTYTNPVQPNVELTIDTQEGEGRDIHFNLNITSDWHKVYSVQLTALRYNPDGTQEFMFKSRLPKSQLIQLHNFTASALAHYDK